MRAFCLIRPEPHYRRDAFMSGLKAAGYDARTGVPMSVEPGDVIVSWNRYSPNHELCTRFEKAGGVAVIAENGYVGPGGISPHQMDPRSIYALAIGGHNGSGRHYVGGPERWAALNVDLKPWRTEGEHILVAPNRSFGRPDLIQPLNWAQDVAKRLSRITKRPIRTRPHPGNGAQKSPLERDLENAWACVIWSSSAGVQALIAGIPVICDAPFWVGRRAAFTVYGSELDTLEECGTRYLDACRRQACNEIAWAQWHVSEIASGEAFDFLLRAARKAEVAASA